MEKREENAQAWDKFYADRESIKVGEKYEIIDKNSEHWFAVLEVTGNPSNMGLIQVRVLEINPNTNWIPKWSDMAMSPESTVSVFPATLIKEFKLIN